MFDLNDCAAFITSNASKVLAVRLEKRMSAYHDEPNPLCPVGRNIHTVMDGKLIKMQEALENEMARTTLADVIKETKQLIAKEKRK